MVLGLLQAGPQHGYELHRIVVAHGTLYADFKKPTLYHLLHRLTVQGAVEVHAEGGTRGRLGERLVFALTPAGATKFQELLRHALSTYDPAQTAFEMATAYLPWIPPKEAAGAAGEAPPGHRGPLRGSGRTSWITSQASRPAGSWPPAHSPPITP